MAERTTLGAYTILEHLRHVGATDTYLAEHTVMRTQRVLLRVLDSGAGLEAVESFEREARTAAKLNHDGIAGVLDLQHADGVVYAVLEYIDGSDLEQLRDAHGALPAEVVAAIGRDVFRALEHAHAHGVLHRRLRPRMVKLTPEGRVKVVGFGVGAAGLLDPTVPGEARREDLYRSPEQLRHQPEDDGTDLYACGVVFYEMLAGQLPFDTPPPPLAATRRPAPLHDANPLAPPALAAVVEGLLADARDARPESASAVRLELEGVLEEMGVPSGSDLLRDYLAQPIAVVKRTRQRGLERLLRGAERLAAGPSRAAALGEVQRLLALEPGHAGAQALLARLEPAPAAPGAGAAEPTVILERSPVASAPAADAASEPTVMLPPSAAAKRPAPAADAASEPTVMLPPSAAAKRPAPAADAASEPTVMLPPSAAARPASRPTPAPAAARERASAPPAAAPVAPPAGRPAWLVPAIVVGALAVVAALAWLLLGHSTGGSAPAGGAFASLDVQSQPPSATVTIRERHESRTAPTTFDQLPPGEYHVHAQLVGYLSRDTVVTVATGPARELSIALASDTPGPAPDSARAAKAAPEAPAAPCTLFVVAHPAADQVAIDGRRAARRDSTFWAVVSPRTHDVHVARRDFLPEDVRVSARAGTHNQVTLALRHVPVASEPAPVATKAPAPAAPEPAAAPMVSASGGVVLHVEAKPWADVLVDGAPAASHVTKGDVRIAPDAEHTVQLANPEYLPWSKRVSVRAGREDKLKFDFTAGSGGVSVQSDHHELVVFIDGRSTGETPPMTRQGLRTGTHVVQLREHDGVKVVAEKSVIVGNSAQNVPVKL